MPKKLRSRLSHYASKATQRGGLGYLARRAGELIAWRFRLHEYTGPLRLHRRQVRALVATAIVDKGSPADVLYVGNIADHMAAPPNRKGAFPIDDRIEDGRPPDLRRLIAQDRPDAESSVLVIYAMAGLLGVWERLEEDLDLCFARGYRQIILALCTGQFRPIDFEGHSYILSVLLNSFPRRKFSSKLDVFVAPEFLNTPGRPLLRPLQALAEEARRKFRRFFWRPRSDAEAVSPTHFSALIVSVEPRDARALRADCELAG